MSIEHPPTDFYVTGGTMSPDAESYVVRSADEELFRAVERGEFCYVLTTRQMGKSSLMARTAQRLAAAGVRSAQITLETIRESSEVPIPDKFLYGIARRIDRELRVTTTLVDWWQERELLSATQRFHEFLTELLLESCESPIVVFIDEIDSTIGLPFADDFYATIRACYNGRASKPELKRLTFVLLGVATPAQLVTDPARTPFNVGKGIELTDFTAEEAEPLSRGFPGTPEDRHTLLERVLYWTGGHPYLTQMLCRAIATHAQAAVSDGCPPAADITAMVDGEVDRLFLRSEASREERNLKFVRSRLTQGHRDLRSVLRTYQRVLAGKGVEDRPASSIHASLKLAGVVRVDATGQLRTRNRVYEQVFGREWVKRELPRDRARLIASAAAVVLLLGGGLSFYIYRGQQASLAQQTAQLRETETRLSIANLARLAGLARENPYLWQQGSRVVSETFLREIEPSVFASAPWYTADVQPAELMDIIERGHPLFVPSRPLFGAMSFALEEVFLRNAADAQVKERARALSETVRTAFIKYHKENTPNFQLPPARAMDDKLNAWVALPAGEFVMGDSDDGPMHSVRLSGFSIQQHEVTNVEYGRFDPAHEFPVGDERNAVTNVSWYEATAYAAWLGASLPTEAQWEYAARGTGSTSGRRYPWGDAQPDETRAASSRAPVGSRPAGRTPEGLDDMAGSVWEWCRDGYGSYAAQAVSDPLGPIAGDAVKVEGGMILRLMRGGSFNRTGDDLRAAYRSPYTPDDPNGLVGFRVVSSHLRP